MCEKRDPARGAEIARLVAQQRADQMQDSRGVCSTGVELTTGLHFEVGLKLNPDKRHITGARDAVRAQQF